MCLQNRTMHPLAPDPLHAMRIRPEVSPENGILQKCDNPPNCWLPPLIFISNPRHCVTSTVVTLVTLAHSPCQPRGHRTAQDTYVVALVIIQVCRLEISLQMLLRAPRNRASFHEPVESLKGSASVLGITTTHMHSPVMVQHSSKLTDRLHVC